MGGRHTALLFLVACASAQNLTAQLTILSNVTASQGVVIGSGGVLYGATEVGGTGTCFGVPSSCGTVYSLTPPGSPGGAWTETVLYNFAGGTDGGQPYASVAVGGGGVLYGTTAAGGTGACDGGCGTVFSLTPPASPGGPWTEAVLHSFTGGSDGTQPLASVAIDSGGVLYGTTIYGGTYGTVFSVTPPLSPGGAWTEAVLHSFAGASDGSFPMAGVAIGREGVLYGTTTYGGISDYGTVFELRPPSSTGGAWTERVLHSFAGIDRTDPQSGVVIGNGDVLYGTTSDPRIDDVTCGPGLVRCGKVYSLKPPASPGGTWTETGLYTFKGGDDGYEPLAGVALGRGEVLYGTTVYGGSGGNYGGGTVYSLAPPQSAGGAWTETVLYRFSVGNGVQNPYAGVAIGAGGILFGTTNQAVFELLP